MVLQEGSYAQWDCLTYNDIIVPKYRHIIATRRSYLSLALKTKDEDTAPGPSQEQGTVF